MKRPINVSAGVPERLSIWQALCTPLFRRANIESDRAQRAYRLLRRYEACLFRLRHKHARHLRAIGSGGEKRGDWRALLALLIHGKQLALLESLAPGSGGQECRIILSAAMLRASFSYCTQDEKEGLHFILGVEYDGLRIGTEMRTFRYAVQSVVAAEGDLCATHGIEVDAHETGHCIVAMLHSHPGRDPNANRPSGVDLRTQQRIELTSRRLGGIWSRDGNLRFYGQAAADVYIVGTDMEKNDDGTWQLVEKPSDSASLEMRDAQIAGRGV